MRKTEEAREILRALQLPERQQSDLCCYTLLAMADIREDSPWATAANHWIRIHDVIAFTREYYAVAYAENSRETFRKQAMHHFRNAALIEDNGQATNSPNYRYRLTEEMLGLIRSYGKTSWDGCLRKFLSNHETLTALYQSKQTLRKMPVQINSEQFLLSSGSHNRLQKAVLEEFAPRFAPDAKCLYLGDTVERDLFKDEEALSALGFTITLHDKMPDIVLYAERKNWLYFIEAVTSVGPMDPKRVREIQTMTANVSAETIYVTAFPDFKTYKRFSASLAWETEVWIAEEPDHMIHLNGSRFLGPYSQGGRV